MDDRRPPSYLEIGMDSVNMHPFHKLCAGLMISKHLGSHENQHQRNKKKQFLGYISSIPSVLVFCIFIYINWQ
jgi:hypothetical protein